MKRTELKRTELKRGKGLEPMSVKKRAERAAAGDPHPSSTLPPRKQTPKMATQPAVKRPRDTGPSDAVRALVKTRSGGWCELTRCTVRAEHIHHRRPRRMGGTRDAAANRASNLLYLCEQHHAWVESRRGVASARGLLLSATADPTRVPVLLRHHPEPVWLDDLGNWHPYEEGAA